MDFRFSRLLNAMINPHDLQAQRDADNELQAVERGTQTGGFKIPREAVARLQQRDLTTATGSGDGAVETTHRPEKFVDSLLGMNYILPRARVYNGLNGEVNIPAENVIATTGWVAENAAPTESDPTIRQIALRPKKLASYVDVSRALIVMGLPDVEDLVIRLLLRIIARALDNAALYGTGMNNQPTGVSNLTGRNSDISLTAANSKRGDKQWEALCDAEQALAEANVDESRVEALMSSYWHHYCRVNSYDGGANRATVNSGFRILPEMDSMLMEQYPVTKSGIASTGSGMFLGDWGQVIIGQWLEGFEIITNPYELDTQGLIRITVHTLADIQFEHTTSFQRILVS